MTQPYPALNQSPTMVDAASALSNTWAADENTFGPAVVPPTPVVLDDGIAVGSILTAPTAGTTAAVAPASIIAAITVTAATTAAAVGVQVAAGPRASISVGLLAGAAPVYTVYDVFKSGVLDGVYDLNAAAVKAALVSGYTFDPAHTSIADVTAAGGVINSVSGAFTNPQIMRGGLFGADDTPITTVAAAGIDHYLLVFQASAAGGGADLPAAGQRLIAFYGTGSGLPVRPSGGTITIAWPHHILQI